MKSNSGLLSQHRDTRTTSSNFTLRVIVNALNASWYVPNIPLRKHNIPKFSPILPTFHSKRTIGALLSESRPDRRLKLLLSSGIRSQVLFLLKPEAETQTQAVAQSKLPHVPFLNTNHPLETRSRKVTAQNVKLKKLSP